MKIKSICELVKVYNGILNFFIDSGFGELADLTPSAALDNFIDSYSELGTLISYWEERGMPAMNCSENLSF